MNEQCQECGGDNIKETTKIENHKIIIECECKECGATWEII